MTKRKVWCKNMPDVVAKLMDWGCHISITGSNEFDENGNVTDFFIITADCDDVIWERAMARTPQWYPVTLA